MTYQADVGLHVHFLSKNDEKLGMSSLIPINGGPNYCAWMSSSFLYELHSSLRRDTQATSGWSQTLDHSRLVFARRCFCLMNLIFHF